MDEPIKNVKIIGLNKIPIGRLVSLPRKLKREVELFMIKKSPYGADPLREFIIRKVKTPLMVLFDCVARGKVGLRELIILFRLVRNFRKLPDPTKDNTWSPNTHTLLDLRDEFFCHENTLKRYGVLRMLWNFIIILYDSDRYYRERMDWVMGRLCGRGWKPFEGEERPRKPWWKDGQ